MSDLVPPNPKKGFDLHPVLVAIAGEVPVLGGVVNGLVGTFQQRRDREIYDFLEQIAVHLNEQAQADQTKLDIEHIGSEYYSTVLAGITQTASSEVDEDKKKYLKNFLIRFSKHARPDIGIIGMYCTFLRNLSGAHIMVLDHVSSVQGHLSPAEIKLLMQQADKPEAISCEVLARTLDMETNVVEALAASLEAHGLVVTAEGEGAGTDDSTRVFLKPLGRSFIQFLSEDG